MFEDLETFSKLAISLDTAAFTYQAAVLTTCISCLLTTDVEER
jgi:hypothetical protein